MSKLSEGLKALVNASHARPHTIPAPSNIKSIYSHIAETATSHNVGVPAWLTISTAATMTMNSPQSLSTLHSFASSYPSSRQKLNPTLTAELMREVGLKCISFNGIPRTINMLGAFYNSLSPEIQSNLSTKPTRRPTPENIENKLKRGRELWDSIYLPLDLSEKLLTKLAQSHPNLPVHILSSHYGLLLSDPEEGNMPINSGRILSSLIALACLRAQSGVGPQVLSHVFGLRKAFDDGSAESEDEVQGGKWLAGEEGNKWILESIDQIVSGIGGKEGSSFAPGFVKAKL